MRVTPALSSSFHTLRSTRSTPSCNVLESMAAGSMCAKRDRSSNASASRDTSSACARAHVSARSLIVRLRKLSYSAASRRCRSFQTSTSDTSVGGAPDATGAADAAGVSGGSPVSGSSEGTGGWWGRGCLLVIRELSVWQQDTRRQFVWKAPRVPHLSPARIAIRATICRNEMRHVRHHAWHSEQLMRELRVPVELRTRREIVGEAPGDRGVDHPILACKQEQQRTLDALSVRQDCVLRPLQLGPRAGCHVAASGSRRQHRPQIGEPRGNAFPRGGSPAPREPGTRDDGGRGRLARLSFEVAQHDQAAETLANQDLRDLVSLANGTTKRL